MNEKNSNAISKLNRKEIKEWILAFFLCLPFAAVYATPAWATETKSFLDQIITGLKWIGGGIATILLLWIAYEVMWGGKRLQDCKNWIIGAIIFAASGHIVDMFFGTANSTGTNP